MRERSWFRNVAEYAVARFAIATLALGPRWFSESLGAFYARMLDKAIPRLRRTGIENLAFAYPDLFEPERKALIDGVFRSIGRVLVAFARFPSLNQRNVGSWIRYEGLEHFLQAKQAGKGVLVATAHLGNWELSAFAHAIMTEPMAVVVRPLDNPRIDAFVERRRAMSGNQLIGKKDFARTILATLRSGRAVGVLVDQNSTPENGAFVPFFGRMACAHTTFARLAAKTGAPVIPGYAVWNESERRYVLHFEAPVPIVGDELQDTAAIQAALEAAVRRYPDQWLWIHRRWKTQPARHSTHNPALHHERAN